MAAQLLQHMVEEAEARVNVTLPGTVQVQTNSNLRFIGIALDDSNTGRITQELIDGFPTGCSKGRAGVGLLPYQDCLAPKVHGQLHIGKPVANNKGIGQVVPVGGVEVVAEQAGTRLARRQVFMRKATVNVFSREPDTLGGQNVAHQLMSGPERVLRKTSRTQAVLIGHQNQLVFGQFAGNAGQSADGPRQELKFIGRQAVDLLAGLGLHQNGAVAVDEQSLFQYN